MKKLLIVILSFLNISLISAQTSIEPVVQFGHVGAILTEIIFSPDSKMMATTDGEYLKIWDIETGLEIRAFAKELYEMSNISHINFLPNNEHIMYKAGGKIYVRDITSGEIIKKIIKPTSLEENEDDKEPSKQDVLKEKNQEIYEGVTLSEDGVLIATLSSKGIEIKDYKTGQVLIKIKTPDRDSELDIFATTVFDMLVTPPLVFSPDKKLILYDNIVYNVSNGKKVYEVGKEITGFRPMAAEFSQDGNKLVVGGGIIDPEEVDKNANGIMGITFEYMKKLYSSEKEKLLFVYDAKKGEMIRSITTNCVHALNLSEDGISLLTGQTENTIRVWNLNSGELVFSKVISPPVEKSFIENNPFSDLTKNVPVSAVAFLPSKNIIVSRGGDNETSALVLWDAKSGKKIRNLGANIPAIKLEGQADLSDFIILREYEEKMTELFAPLSKKYKGFRILNMKNGKVPHVYSKYDTITLSSKGQFYVLHKKNETLKVFETEFNTLLIELQKSREYSNIVFNIQEGLVAAARKNYFAVWRITDGKLIWENKAHKKDISHLFFNESNNTIGSICEEEAAVSFWSVDTQDQFFEVKGFGLKGLNEIKDGAKKVSDNILSATKSMPQFLKNKIPLAKQTESTAETVNTTTSLLQAKGYYDIEFSTDGKTAAIWSENRYSIKFLDLENKEQIQTIRDGNLMAMQKMFLPMLTIQMQAADAMLGEGEDYSFNFSKFIKNYFIESYNLKNTSAISPDFSQFAKATKSLNSKKGEYIKIINIEHKEKGKKKKQSLEDSSIYQEGLTYSQDGKFIAASSRSENKIRIWNVETGKIVKTLSGHSGKITFGPRGKTLISSGWDRQIKIWDIENDKLLYSFIGIKNTNDYVIILPSGHYTTSRKNSKAIAFRKGKKAFSFEQFDLQFNRPDSILATFGSSIQNILGINPNENLIKAYRRAYEKRLEQSNFSEEDFDKKIAVPKITIRDIPFITQDKKLLLEIEAIDASYHLKQLHIYINGVPVWGRKGKDLSALNTKKWQDEVSVELSNGKNTIQFFVLNKKGVKSLYSTHQIIYNGQISTSSLYVVTLGGSNFKDTTMNLRYADKDISDVKKYFKNAYTHKDTRFIDYSNTKFTVENIDHLKTVLSQTKVDDEVIIFIATHGLIDSNLDYYFATHEVDFYNPSVKGLSYYEFEDLLDEIPARRKIVFIDACHAGELDKTEVKLSKLEATTEGEIIMRSFKSGNWNKFGVQNSFDLMKELFIDLRGGTGTTVIASTSGAEFALEGKKWNNSVFTYSLLSGLKNKTADLNFDGEITILELQEYLYKMVGKLTKGLQEPTYRSENIINDWRIW